MKIQIKCRVRNLKISDAKSIGITICDELQVCNSVGAWGVNLDTKEPIFFDSKNLTIEKGDKFFDFISAHVRDTFLITIETEPEEKKKSKNEEVSEGEWAIIKVRETVYQVVEVELIYG